MGLDSPHIPQELRQRFEQNVPVLPTQLYTDGRGTNPLILKFGTRCGVSGQHETSLYHLGKNPNPEAHCKGGWVGPRIGLKHFWRKYITHTGIWTSDHWDRSEALYRLLYPGSQNQRTESKNFYTLSLLEDKTRVRIFSYFARSNKHGWAVTCSNLK